MSGITTEAVAHVIATGDYKKIVILSGAGVSTNAGIPDYRSPKGVYAKLAASNKYPDAKYPEAFFSRQFVDAHPELNDEPLVKEFREQLQAATPQPAHYLAKLLDDKGMLLRVFTQNVDGLYRKAGLAEDRLVEFHGNYSNGTMVLYGDPIPESALEAAKRDLPQADLIIVMGTSLLVKPFADLPDQVSKKCVRILVDLNVGMITMNAVSWFPGQKYRYQYLCTSDCDNFATIVTEKLNTDDNESE